MKRIVVVGEILVEIMADTPGMGFQQCQPLTGPYPSGAPAIFASQAARMGQPVAIIGSVGNDDFGCLTLDRLNNDGVVTRGIHTDPDRPTGSAFVRYRPDGTRDFVFNIRHSAAGHLTLSDTAHGILDEADHLHVMGSSLSGEAAIRLNIDTAKAVKDRGGTVSFDPNLRKELLDAEGLSDALFDVLELTDLYLPSGPEMTLLTKADQTEEAVQELLGRGVRVIVQKLGASGAAYFDSGQMLHTPAFVAEEVDPTGAGDCFSGTFTSLWLRGADPHLALTLANAAGALAVAKRGPMEGASDLATIERFAREGQIK
ncbi:MAG: sugar kinase [Pseudomonadota bacterium]